jgi:hypothetical protein
LTSVSISATSSPASPLQPSSRLCARSFPKAKKCPFTRRQRNALSPLPFPPWQLWKYRLSLLHLKKQPKQSLLHVTGHKKHLYQAQNLPFRLRQLRLTPTPLLPRLLLLLLLSEIWCAV